MTERSITAAGLPAARVAAAGTDPWRIHRLLQRPSRPGFAQRSFAPRPVGRGFPGTSGNRGRRAGFTRPEGDQPMGEIPEPDELIPLAEERLRVEKREVERGRVVVRKRVETREELAEAVLHREELSVERVPLGVPVDAPPPVREEEGDVLIVPVLEEQLVVRTRLILKEELRVTRHRRAETFREPVRLRAEVAEVAREPGRDPAVDT